jgi:hypothetical protein
MPLLDLKTDLKSLKYGQDQPGGGSSGFPFITTDVDSPHNTRINFGSNNLLSLVGVNSIPLIPNISANLNRSRIGQLVNGFLNSDDFIRGGAAGSVQSAINDVFRIGSFFLSPPKGPVFIAKQVGLQLTNPKLEVKKGVGGAASGVFTPGGLLGTLTGGQLGPTRIYNLGINTLAQVGVNAFGGHFVRHGLGPVQSDDTKYEAVVTFNNNSQGSKNNRLVELKDKFKLGDNQTNLIITPRIARVVNSALSAVSALTGGTSFVPLSLNPRQLNIDSYATGPGSVYGIGGTVIKRSSFTEDKFIIDDLAKTQRANLKLSQANTNYYTSQGVSRLYFSSATEVNEYNRIDANRPNKKPGYIDTATYSTIQKRFIPITADVQGNISSTNQQQLQGVQVKASIPVQNATYKRYREIIESKKLKEQTYKIATTPITLPGSVSGFTELNEFGVYGGNNVDQIVGAINNGGNVLPTSQNLPIYSNGTKVIRIGIPWNKATREVRVGSGLRDEINLTPLFKDNGGSIPDEVTIGGTKHNINDLVKFRIQAVNGVTPSNSDWMIFRAYVTQFSDNTDASWNPVKYAGRGEDFYIYNGFSRKIQIGFKAAALSAEEMEPMYQKLNYLMSNLMPDYDNNLMRGPLVKMTVGNWIDGQVGVLNNISYNVPQDSPWEISLNEPLRTINDRKQLILPHVVEVSMTFTPIGSQTKGQNLLSQKSSQISNIAQNVNDYQFIKGNIQQGT